VYVRTRGGIEIILVDVAHYNVPFNQTSRLFLPRHAMNQVFKYTSVNLGSLS
jgi:hypothetical protein